MPFTLFVNLYRSDNKDYALKLIEGTGYSQSFSLSACREVAVSNIYSSVCVCVCMYACVWVCLLQCYNL